MTAVWGIYAQLQPDVMWIEDDLRNFNHDPVQYGCFCDRHLDRFKSLVGEHVAREALVSHLLASGTPHPYREAYLSMQGEITNEIVEKLSGALRTTAPETTIGLMSSGPFLHVVEGRDWTGLAETSHCHPLISRPPLGNYSEGSLRGLYASQHSIKLTRAALPAGTVEMTEIENIPFTQYTKSNAFTFLQMAISFAMGCEGVTLNTFDHRGSLMEDDPGVGKMLGGKKAYLSAIKQAANGEGANRGAQLLFDPHYSFRKHLPKDASYSALAVTDEAASRMLEPLGIPCTYGDAPVTVVTGQMLRCLTDADIRDLLRKGLLIDSVAAGILSERGFGAHIGVASLGTRISLKHNGPYAAEEYFNEDFGGEPNDFLTIFLPEYGSMPTIRKFELLQEVTVISHLVDADRAPREPVLFVTDNALGGRVAVFAYELGEAVGTAFYHAARRRQMVHLMKWLSNDRFPAIVHGAVYPLLICRDRPGETFCALFNLMLDPYEKVSIELYDQRVISRISSLSNDGRWVDASQHTLIETDRDHHLITLNQSVTWSTPCCLNVSWEEKSTLRQRSYPKANEQER
ncbi:MAG: hypothetical protein ISS31_02870 [Kiritimatiellae bacterium]|nr:hypothetical protein [Kiritimatiellia bacterium]